MGQGGVCRRYRARFTSIPGSATAHHCWQVGWEDADTEVLEQARHNQAIAEGKEDGYCETWRRLVDAGVASRVGSMAHLTIQIPMPQSVSHLRDHIQIIAKHEQEFIQRRTRSEKLGDSLGTFIGSLTFVSIHVCWFTAWVSINIFSLGVPHFDPHPFSLLNTIVALEAVFLASFIVMRQGRASRRSDERDHLILQILMLTEKEITAALGIERQIAARMGIEEVARDAGIERLIQETSIDAVAQEVQQHLADE